jgi:hypothetical protein
MLHQHAGRPAHTQRNSIAIIGGIILTMMAVVVVGVAMAPRPATTTPAVTVGPLPFDGMARVLASHCDSAQAIKTAILILVTDGDKDCATATVGALKGIGFSMEDYVTATMGRGVKRGNNTLSIHQATDGAVVAVQQG